MVVEWHLTNGGRGLLDNRRVRMSAILVREGGGCLSVYAHACERRVGRYSRMMRGEDMVVVSIRNYIGRSTVVCPRKGET